MSNNASQWPSGLPTPPTTTKRLQSVCWSKHSVTAAVTVSNQDILTKYLFKIKIFKYKIFPSLLLLIFKIIIHIGWDLILHFSQGEAKKIYSFFIYQEEFPFLCSLFSDVQIIGVRSKYI